MYVLLLMFLLLVFEVFTVWAIIDCVTHQVRNKVLWAILILVTSPIGVIVYVAMRSKLVSASRKPEAVLAEVMPVSSSNSSTTQQVAKGIGISLLVAIGIVALFATLLVIGGFFLFFTMH